MTGSVDMNYRLAKRLSLKLDLVALAVVLDPWVRIH